MYKFATPLDSDVVKQNLKYGNGHFWDTFELDEKGWSDLSLFIAYNCRHDAPAIAEYERLIDKWFAHHETRNDEGVLYATRPAARRPS